MAGLSGVPTPILLDPSYCSPFSLIFDFGVGLGEIYEESGKDSSGDISKLTFLAS